MLPRVPGMEQLLPRKKQEVSLLSVHGTAAPLMCSFVSQRDVSPFSGSHPLHPCSSSRSGSTFPPSTPSIGAGATEAIPKCSPKDWALLSDVHLPKDNKPRNSFLSSVSPPLCLLSNASLGAEVTSLYAQRFLLLFLASTRINIEQLSQSIQ